MAVPSIASRSSDKWVVRSGDFLFHFVKVVDGQYVCSCKLSGCEHVKAVKEDRAGIPTKLREKSLKPVDLNLPEKFTSFYDSQLQALEVISNTSKRFILVQAPTGAGKTLIVAATKQMLKTKILYTCSTKQLQDQFIRDFAYNAEGNELAVELKGRANYPTLLYPDRFPEINASICTGGVEIHCRWCCDGNCYGSQAEEEFCSEKHKCPYSVQKRHCLAAPISVLNTSLLLNEANYVGGFSDRQMIAVDEADELEHHLQGFIELTITERWIKRLGIEGPKKVSVKESWAEWASTVAIPAAQREHAALVEGWGVSNFKRQKELKAMIDKLEFFVDEVLNGSSRWVFINDNGSFKFKPVYVNKYASRYLWKHAERWMLLSATLFPDDLAFTLNIPKEEIEFIDLPSTFDVERRPIYFLPAANVSRKGGDGELPKLVRAIDSTIDRFPDKKVMVHTVSYTLAAYVMLNSRHKGRMTTHTSASQREEVLKNFTDSPESMILVSPSMTRGVDLYGDTCRLNIIAKVDYPYLGDKQVSARLYSGKSAGRRWYALQAIRSIIQASGRNMRKADDWGVTVIIDQQFLRLYNDNKRRFPQWWRDALHQIEGVDAIEIGKEVLCGVSMENTNGS